MHFNRNINHKIFQLVRPHTTSMYLNNERWILLLAHTHHNNQRQALPNLLAPNIGTN